MFMFITGLILLAVAVAVFFVKISTQENVGTRYEPKMQDVTLRAPRWIAPIILVFALIFLTWSFTTKVNTKEVGVVTTFGQLSERNLDAGLHVKWPWQKVTQLDATTITEKFTGCENDDKCHASIPVRIADGSTATINTTIRWRIDPDHASELFANYRSSNVNENIADSLVKTQLTASVASVFTDFDPLLIPKNPTNTITAAPDLDKFSLDVTEAMDTHLRDASNSSDGQPEVDIVSITISYITLSDKTQERLNNYQTEVANTRIATQQAQTAAQQALANKTLADSVSNDPNVLVSKCFDLMNEMIKEGQTIPPGFTCWPGGSNVPVVIPSK